MFKRIPDKMLAKVAAAGGRPFCKCICPEFCACLDDPDGAYNYTNDIPVVTASTSATNFKNRPK